MSLHNAIGELLHCYRRYDVIEEKLQELSPEVVAIVKRHLADPPWRVVDMFAEARRVDSRVATMGLSKFQRIYVSNLINGKKEGDGSRIPEISVPKGLHERLTERMRDMETAEDRKKREAKYVCPCGEYWTDSNQGIALHLSKSHTDEEETEYREELGLPPKGATTKKQPLLLSPEKQEQVLEILRVGIQAPKRDLPDREEVRSAFLSFAREVRDTSDALEVAQSLDTFVDLMYDLFTGESDD